MTEQPTDRKPAVWAHRGASADAPENTLPAFELALQQGADGFELDIQFTRDDEIVVIHDETLERTTDGTGWVADHSLADLAGLDASNGFSRFTGTRIPTLQQVLGLVRDNDATVNIELKNSQMRYLGMEEKLAAMLADFGSPERFVLSSFNHYSLRKLAGLGVRSTLGALFGEPLFRPWKYAQKLGVGALHPPCSRPTLSAKLVRRCHESGLKVHLWTVNDRADLEWAARHGVDAVITDTPAKARNLYG